MKSEPHVQKKQHDGCQLLQLQIVTNVVLEDELARRVTDKRRERMEGDEPKGQFLLTFEIREGLT